MCGMAGDRAPRLIARDRRLQIRVVALPCPRGFPTEAYTGLHAGEEPGSGLEVGNGGRLPAAGLGLAMCSRRKKGGDPVTISPTVICEVVAS